MHSSLNDADCQSQSHIAPIGLSCQIDVSVSESSTHAKQINVDSQFILLRQVGWSLDGR